MYQLKFNFYYRNNLENEAIGSTVHQPQIQYQPEVSLTQEQLQAIKKLKQEYERLLQPQIEALN